MAARRWALAAELLLAAQLRPGSSQTGQFANEATWSYAEQYYWGDISGASCVNAKQSPIDINTSSMIDGGSSDLLRFKSGYKVGPLFWSFLNATVRVALSSPHSGWLVELEAPYSETTTSTYYGHKFHLQSMTFHSPSENTVDGQHYDMEAQLLHTLRGARGVTHHLVTSVMLRVDDSSADPGAGNEFLQAVWSHFPNTSQPGLLKPRAYIGNPYRFLYPRDRSYYAFNGSLTAPPCSPAVWVVFASPARIGARQLQSFRERISALQPSRLRYAPSGAPPAGVACAAGCPGLGYRWNTSLGMNARDAQAGEGRWVKHVRMLAPRSAAAGRASGGAGWSWWWWCLLGLGVLLLAGCAVGIAMHDARSVRSRRKQGSRSEDTESDGNGDAKWPLREAAHEDGTPPHRSFPQPGGHHLYLQSALVPNGPGVQQYRHH